MSKTATKKRTQKRASPPASNGNPKSAMKFVAPVTITARGIFEWNPEQARNAVAFLRKVADDLSDAAMRQKIGRVWRARLFSLD